MVVTIKQNKTFILKCQGDYRVPSCVDTGSPLFVSPHAPGYDFKRLKTLLNTRLSMPLEYWLTQWLFIYNLNLVAAG